MTVTATATNGQDSTSTDFPLITPVRREARRFQRYVSIIAIDQVADELLLLRKVTGPEHLIGKQTFPGRKIERIDQSVAHAASREILEKAGLAVLPADLVYLTRKGDQNYSLDVFMAVVDLSATGPQPNEAEPVYRASWSKTKQDVIDRPDDYARDTGYFLGCVAGVKSAARHRLLLTTTGRLKVDVHQQRIS